jgi:hypothetical protein
LYKLGRTQNFLTAGITLILAVLQDLLGSSAR